MNINAIAQIAHEANRALCLSQGDASQPAWSDAPEWQTTSAIKGVEFHLTNPDADAAASHNAWLEEKARDGWIYGAIKDPEAKTHPCYIAFELLPPEQQAKDHLFRSIVHALKPFMIGRGN